MDQVRFSVCQYFSDDADEYVRRFVNVDEAIEVFGACVVAKSTKRVVVTDGQVSVEWTVGGGIRKAKTQV